MSIKLITACWDRGPKSQSPLLVMMALADRADDQGGSCFPKIDEVARKSRMSARNAMNILAQLERDGWIEIDRRALDNVDRRKKKKKQGKVNNYTINLAKLGLAPSAIPELISRENSSPENPSGEKHSGESTSSESTVQKHHKHGGKPVGKGWKSCA